MWWTKTGQLSRFKTTSFTKVQKIAHFDGMALCGHFDTLKHSALKDVLTAPCKHDLAQTSHTHYPYIHLTLG